MQEINDLPAAKRAVFARRIRRLADYLDTVSRSQYEHLHYGQKTACGTTACAIGHAHVSGLFKSAGLRGTWRRDPWNDADRLDVHLKGEDPEGLYATDLASGHVFGPGVIDAVFHRLDGTIKTPKQAARALRRFADKHYGKRP